jgi:hypothetical protein
MQEQQQEGTDGMIGEDVAKVLGQFQVEPQVV